MKERFKHLLLFTILLVIDQGSKFWVRTYLADHGPIKIIPSVLNLQYLKNSGAVWGILSGKVNFLIILTFLILVVILFAYFKIPNEKKYNLLKILAVFIVAGAIGNLIDRLYLGYVVDFIYFEIINFPLFNFADSCLTVASIILLILALFYYKDDDFSFLVKRRIAKDNCSSKEISDSETDSSNAAEKNKAVDDKDEVR